MVVNGCQSRCVIYINPICICSHFFHSYNSAFVGCQNPTSCILSSRDQGLLFRLLFNINEKYRELSKFYVLRSLELKGQLVKKRLYCQNWRDFDGLTVTLFKFTLNKERTETSKKSFSLSKFSLIFVFYIKFNWHFKAHLTYPTHVKLTFRFLSSPHLT